MVIDQSIFAQIVGHTKMTEIAEVAGVVFVDCLEYEERS